MLGRSSLPFTGHGDEFQCHPNVEEYSRGGMSTFIKFWVIGLGVVDTELENHLKTCSKNASYVSKTSQKELINRCGKFIKDALIKVIKESKFVLSLADEGSECSNQGQSSFFLRFADKDDEIIEDVLGFLHCELALSEKGLVKTFLTEIGNLTLDINNCHWQGYDGAASVSDHISLLSGHTLRINERTVYAYCHNHRLKLVVDVSCSIDQIQEFLFFL